DVYLHNSGMGIFTSQNFTIEHVGKREVRCKGPGVN
ncbi:unnamed protein product, partial [marine sediment metagenome]